MSETSFETFFLATAGAGGAFIGLLFVALSIAPKTTFGHMAGSDAPRQQLAEGQLLGMANGFIVSSIALIPGVNVGWVAFGGGIWGVAAAAYIAWCVARFHWNGPLHETWGHLARVVSLSMIAAAIYAIEATLGLRLLFQENAPGAMRGLALVVIALYAMAILRAWILLGDPVKGLSGLMNPLQAHPPGASLETAGRDATAARQQERTGHQFGNEPG